jgi:hypothetical protein
MYLYTETDLYHHSMPVCPLWFQNIDLAPLTHFLVDLKALLFYMSMGHYFVSEQWHTRGGDFGGSKPP